MMNRVGNQRVGGINMNAPARCRGTDPEDQYGRTERRWVSGKGNQRRKGLR